MKYLFLVYIFFLWGCKKCEDCSNNTPQLPKVNLSFSFQYADKILTTNEYYNTESQDTFRTTMLKFYISNIILVKNDGTEYKEPESYHLFSLENPVKNRAIIKDVPAGEYTKIRFAIGIDSVRNHSGAQMGDLDPANGMFWTWSDGYLFLRYEGVLKKTPAKGLIVHIGEDRYFTPYELVFPSPLRVDYSQSEFDIPLSFNLYNLFNSPHVIDVDSLAHGYPGKVVENLPFLINFAP